MQQGSSASAPAARMAGMTDEQILDLDMSDLEATFSGTPAQNAGAAWATTQQSQRDASSLRTGPQNDNEQQRQAQDDMAVLEGSSSSSRGATTTSLSAESPTNRRLSAHDNRQTSEPYPPAPSIAERVGAQGELLARETQGEPAWLKQLDPQPAAAAEARQWREAAQNVAALDAAYFSSDASARSGLAARLYESDPAAFREMLAASARMLSERDPQALTELARRLGVSETQTTNAPAKSLAQAARSLEANAAAQNQAPANNGSADAFPAEAYRAFETAANEDVARATREAIGRTLSSTLPEEIGEGARRRIGNDIFQELHATLSGDRELGRQVGEILRGWNFDGATRQQVVSLITSRARAAMPEVARRVIAEWTSSVLASDRTRAARVDAAAARRDVTGGSLPATIPASALLPRKIDYSKMTDEQILDL
jgi:hypothetical protein